MDEVASGLAVVGVVTLAVIGGLGVWAALASRETFEVGDVLWCDAGGDAGYFTVLDKRNGEYRIGEGNPPIEDLGWWSEAALLTAPWLCERPGQ